MADLRAGLFSVRAWTDDGKLRHASFKGMWELGRLVRLFAKPTFRGEQPPRQLREARTRSGIPLFQQHIWINVRQTIHEFDATVEGQRQSAARIQVSFFWSLPCGMRDAASSRWQTSVWPAKATLIRRVPPHSAFHSAQPGGAKQAEA
ncbi:hypothetical protein GOA69_29680 [Sinorhizobium meliloti]|nr:hypothetical protein [Sinorhizobium meliloti]RVP22629.1 hypothetical protein CN080_15945 [Sinorhizobium meliloti]